MSTVLVVGATGGVGTVVTQKCDRSPIFKRIECASRDLAKYKELNRYLTRPIEGHQLDASDTQQVVEVIRKTHPDLVMHTGLPYHNLSIMEACLETRTNYLDTANYEPEDDHRLRYDEQWAYHEEFRDRGIMALLGCGFDPGVTNVFCAYALKNYFREIHTIDIMDCNGGDHGQKFASNFNLAINLREFLGNRYCYWQNGKWVPHAPLWSPEAIHQTFDFDEIGPREMYALFHEEMDSLALYIPGVKRMRFWMTFGKTYIEYLRMFMDVGMASIHKWTPSVPEISPRHFLEMVVRNKRLLKKYHDLLEPIGLLSDGPIKLDGKPISPLEFLQKILPAPSSLGENYTGKTNIGVRMEGISKNGHPMKYYVYNICDHHERAFLDCRAQAVSYTTGVPVAVGAEMMITGQWSGEGVFHPEQFDPDPFLDRLWDQGLPFKELFDEEIPDLKF